jgi:hypothetical protein
MRQKDLRPKDLAMREDAEWKARQWVKRAERSKQAEEAKRDLSALAKCVGEALRLLGSPTKTTTRWKVQYAVTFARRLRDQRSSSRYGTQTKPQKAAAKRFAAALRRLETELNSPDLAEDVRPDFPLDDMEFVRWIARADAAASKKLNDSNPRNQAKRYAAKTAAQLLKAHGLPVRATRGGPLCRLAALIYGEPHADFLHHCRRAKADLNSDDDRPG